MFSDFQGNIARKWLSRGLNLSFNLSFFLWPMSCKIIFWQKKKQSQDAECWLSMDCFLHWKNAKKNGKYAEANGGRQFLRAAALANGLTNIYFS